MAIKTLHNVPQFNPRTGAELKEMLKFYKISIKEFAAFMGVTYLTAYKWCQRDEIPMYITRVVQLFTLFHPFFVHNRLSGEIGMMENVRTSKDNFINQINDGDE